MGHINGRDCTTSCRWGISTQLTTSCRWGISTEGTVQRAADGAYQRKGLYNELQMGLINERDCTASCRWGISTKRTVQRAADGAYQRKGLYNELQMGLINERDCTASFTLQKRENEVQVDFANNGHCLCPCFRKISTSSMDEPTLRK